MLKKVISPSLAESSVTAEPNYPIMVTKQKGETLVSEQKTAKRGDFDMLSLVC